MNTGSRNKHLTAKEKQKIMAMYRIGAYSDKDIASLLNHTYQQVNNFLRKVRKSPVPVEKQLDMLCVKPETTPEPTKENNTTETRRKQHTRLDEVVKEHIRKEYYKTNVTKVALATRYNVSQTTITRIIGEDTPTHVRGKPVRQATPQIPKHTPKEMSDIDREIMKAELRLELLKELQR